MAIFVFEKVGRDRVLGKTPTVKVVGKAQKKWAKARF
nr:MAG TPA: hypothetical protein [Caudoviricetes sp.]